MEARQKELNSLKSDLEEQRRILRARLGRIIKDMSQTSTDEAREYEEMAQEAENDEVLAQLDARGHEDLQRVEFALQRMGAGDFGTCANCGDPIQIERLKAIPWTTLCFECASDAEG